MYYSYNNYAKYKPDTTVVHLNKKICFNKELFRNNLQNISNCTSGFNFGVKRAGLDIPMP